MLKLTLIYKNIIIGMIEQVKNKFHRNFGHVLLDVYLNTLYE
jgi:hypothetical protein